MRLFITGPTGSGKTTLSKEISQLYSVRTYSLDDIHWVHNPEGDVRRPLDVKLLMLKEITSSNSWIVEGVQFKWADLAINAADKIIVLDIPMARNWRLIMKRFIRQCLGIEKAAYQPNLKSLIRIYRWSADYRSHERDLLLKKLEPFGKKTVVVTSTDSVLNILATEFSPLLS